MKKKKQTQTKDEEEVMSGDFTEDKKRRLIELTKKLKEGKIKIKIDSDDWDII